jgi:hypothetical protein
MTTARNIVRTNQRSITTTPLHGRPVGLERINNSHIRNAQSISPLQEANNRFLDVPGEGLSDRWMTCYPGVKLMDLLWIAGLAACLLLVWKFGGC